MARHRRPSDVTIRGKPRGIRRDRDCRTCKSRGVKCDLNRPSCSPCLEAGLECGGYNHRLKWMEIQGGTTTATATAKDRTNNSNSPPDTAPTDDINHSLDAVRFEAFSWTNSQFPFLRWITDVYDRAKSGYSDTTSLASPVDPFTLLTRVWNYAWTHIEGYLDGSRTHQVDSIEHHVQAIIGLNEAIKQGHLVAIFGITTFAYFDVCEGAFGEWDCHLQGARSLLDLHCQNVAQLERLASEIAGLQEIMTYLVWYDTMGAIIQRRRRLLFDDWHREVMADAFFDSVGCPADTFSFFVALVTSEPSDVELPFRALHQSLQIDTERIDEKSRASSAWRCASILAFADRSCAHPSIYKFMTTESLVERICRTLEVSPASSGYHMHLAAPAYLAGLSAAKERHRQVIRRYWHNCRSYRTVPYYPDAQARCEEMWQRRDLDAADLDKV